MYDYYTVDDKKFDSFWLAMNEFLNKFRTCSVVHSVCMEVRGVCVVDGVHNSYLLFNYNGFNRHQAEFFVEYFSKFLN